MKKILQHLLLSSLALTLQFHHKNDQQKQHSALQTSFTTNQPPKTEPSKNINPTGTTAVTNPPPKTEPPKNPVPETTNPKNEPPKNPNPTGTTTVTNPPPKTEPTKNPVPETTNPKNEPPKNPNPTGTTTVTNPPPKTEPNPTSVKIATPPPKEPHNDPIPDKDPKTTQKTPIESSNKQPTPQERKALDKLMEFVMSDPQLMKSAMDGKQPSAAGKKKIIKWMSTNDEYLTMMIEQMSKQKDSKWIKQLPPSAQKNFAKVTLQFMANQQNVDLLGENKDLTDKQTFQLISKLLEDKEIAKGLIKSIDWDLLNKDEKFKTAAKKNPKFKNYDWSKLTDQQKVQIFKLVTQIASKKAKHMFSLVSHKLQVKN